MDTGTLNGLAGPNILITGANVHIRSGSGTTGGFENGKANLIVGYNEANSVPSDDTLSRGVSQPGGGTAWISISRVTVAYIAESRTTPSRGVEASVSGGSNNTASVQPIQRERGL